jgi:Protein of unknown function (DUF4232)
MRPTLWACVAGCLAAIAATTPASSQTPDRRCVTSELRAISLGQQGAAGTQFGSLRLQLRRPGSCTLRGYPGITLLRGHRRLHLHVTRNHAGPAPRTTHLRWHHPADFNVVYRSYDAGAQRSCHSKVTGLNVIPPNTHRSLHVRLRPKAISICWSYGMTVQPVSAPGTL